MAVQKAYLETENGARLDCLFNPAELSISKSNTWNSEAVAGRETPELRYTGGEAGSMSLDLTFDTTDTGRPVTGHTNKLLELMKVDPGLPGHDETTNSGRPPWVKFHWGDLHGFKAAITSMDVTFTYFSADGMPLRAKVKMSLTQYEPDENWGPQNPTSGTPKPHKQHQVQAGETLDRIAARYYGDPSQWRLIAAANGVADPLALRPGMLLAIPRRRD